MKTTKITLTGEPRSTNHIYRSACQGRYPRRYMTAEGKALKQQYVLEAQNQWKREVLEDELSVSVIFYFKSKRKRDLDNQTKIVLDSLEGIVFANDTQIRELSLHREYDKDNPRIEIFVL